MAVYMKMSSNGEKVPGNVVDPREYEGEWIRLDSVNWDYNVPTLRDSSGMLVRGGAVQSGGVSFHCGLARHAIMIWRALCRNEVVEAEIRYDVSDDGGAPSQIIQLGDARVARCDISMDTLNVQLKFKSMTVDHPDSGFAHSDDLAYHTQ